MHYSIPFNIDFNYVDTIDELQIKYKHSQAENLVPFIEEQIPPQQKLIICPNYECVLDEEMPIFKMAKEIHPNILLRLNAEYINKETIRMMKDAEMPFMFDITCMTKGEVRNQVNLGVSEVEINGDAGFDIINLSNFCHSKGVKVRAIPNAVTPFETQDINCFFIRPEDVHLYEGYIDTLDLRQTKKDRINTVYDIYLNQKFEGELSLLIENLEECWNVPNHKILPSFGQCRLDCQRRCAYDGCRYCEQLAELAESLEKNFLGFKKEPDYSYVGKITRGKMGRPRKGEK